jgi:predicted phosphodiesterase
MILGNHDLRLFKRLTDAGIPSWFMRSVSELLELPDTWQVAEEFECDGVLYVHGEGLNDDPRAAIKKIGQSVVYGHTHKAGIAHYASRLTRLFAMNVGCIVDLKALSFEYSKGMHQKALIGVGVVQDGDAPIFIPMPLESKLTRKGADE